MRITTGPLAGAAVIAVFLLAGCGGSTPSSSPVPAVSVATPTPATTTLATTAAPVTTATPVTTAAPTTAAATTTTAPAKPDTAPLDQMLKNLDSQLAAGTKALNDATAAINSGEGDVTP